MIVQDKIRQDKIRQDNKGIKSSESKLFTSLSESTSAEYCLRELTRQG